MQHEPHDWAWLAAWLEQNWLALYAGLLAGVVAALRVIYAEGTWRRVITETLLCGVFGLACSYGLELLGLDNSSAPFFGGMIGLLGVKAIRATVLRVCIRYSDKH